MSEEKKPLLSDLTQDLGIGATATAVVSGLWVGGWWQWIPAVLVVCVGIYTLVLERPLPWHSTLYKDLQQLNAGTSNHPLLQRVIRRTLDSMLLNGLVQVSSRTSEHNALKASRWHRTMTYANQRLDHWTGRKIWSYSTFDRLLLVAAAYPLLLLLSVWWWTGLGRLGPIEILPPLGSGMAGWGLRSLMLMLMLWPLACLWVYGQKLRLPGTKEGWWVIPAFMLTAIAPSLAMAALVVKTAYLDLAFAAGVFGVVAMTVGLLGIGKGIGVGTTAIAVAGVSALTGAIATAGAAEGVRNFVCEAYDVKQEHVCQAGRPRRRQRPQRHVCRPFPKNSLTSSSLAR